MKNAARNGLGQRKRKGRWGGGKFAIPLPMELSIEGESCGRRWGGNPTLRRLVTRKSGKGGNGVWGKQIFNFFEKGKATDWTCQKMQKLRR